MQPPNYCFTSASTMTTVESWEMVLWRVPSPVPPSAHDLKYSLFYGRPGVREIGYDNERGKGDHRHFRGVETNYAFTTVEQLMTDFWADVRSLRGET